jgi:C4-dicarboxylate-specific signal transduction histidine kinase
MDYRPFCWHIMLMFERFLWSKPSAIMRYALAVVWVALALLMADLMEHYWKSTPYVSLFCCAIVLSAWFGGFGPGLLAIALSVLAFDYYFLPPLHSLLPNSNEMPRLVLFAVVSIIIGLLSAAQRSSAESLRQAHDALAVKVQELERTIAERNHAQDALQKAQADLTHMTRLTTMGELTASIAHEVNQPLTAVLNNASACLDLLPNGATNLGEVREALGEIIEDAGRASDVIVRVRALAKKTPSTQSLVNLAEVVKGVLALARYESTTRSITIHADLPKDLPPVLGDGVQLQQVLLNLVVNAMDAMNTLPGPERVLTIFGRRETRDGTPAALLGVQDVGIGLKADERERLFEPFYSTKPQGMGMGLAISRSIVEAHGGHLWAEPNQGAGATFFFALPAAPKPRGIHTVEQELTEETEP